MAKDWDRWLRDHHPDLSVPEDEIVASFGSFEGRAWHEGHDPALGPCPCCHDLIQPGSIRCCMRCLRSGFDTALAMQLAIAGQPPEPPGLPRAIEGEVAEVREALDGNLLELRFYRRPAGSTQRLLHGSGWVSYGRSVRFWAHQLTESSLTLAMEVAVVRDLQTTGEPAAPAPELATAPLAPTRRERRSARYGQTPNPR